MSPEQLNDEFAAKYAIVSRGGCYSSRPAPGIKLSEFETMPDVPDVPPGVVHAIGDDD